MTRGALAVLGVSVTAAGCGGDGPSTTPSQVAPDASPYLPYPGPLERRLEAALGRDFACVLQPALDNPRPGLVVYVTRAEARGRARDLVVRFKAGARATIKVTGPAEDFVARRHLLVHLRRTRVTDVSVNLRLPASGGCPRVGLLVPTKGRHADAGLRWATAAQQRFGTSRVLIERGNPVNGGAPR